MDKDTGRVIFSYSMISVVVVMVFVLLSSEDIFKVFFLPLLALLAVIGIIVFYIHFSTTHKKMQQKIKHITSLIIEEPAAVLTEKYMEIYQLYSKLSEKHKKYYYQHIIRIREQLENSMQMEKKVETMIASVERKSVYHIKEIYDELYNAFMELPEKAKQKYYSSIINLKRRVEKEG
ncbi:hypothetical protein HYX12_02800 [Candidatus Woesearchaeota archaeon]|nr:hypothetical protein [Candidatus Woesearchaeota archaeon]